MRPTRLASVVAAVLLGAVASAGVPAPAGAASGYCVKGTGVTVVVDHGSLGGGSSIGCDPKGAGTAGSTVVPRAGFPLTYVNGSGFVCRVSGSPGSTSCGSTPPANAYWGLFWSSGKSGTWTYSSEGIGSLTVPKGGFIGWRWQSSNAHTSPGTKPLAPQEPGSKSTPKPSPKPSPKPVHHAAPSPTPAQVPGTPSAGVGAGRSSSSSAAAGAKARAKVTQQAKKQATQQATQQATKQASKAQHQKAAPGADRAKKAKPAARAKPHAAASGLPSDPASSAAAASGSSDDPSTASDTSLTAGERANGGSNPMLAVFATGLVLVLAGAAGRLLWLRRRG